MTSRTDEQIDRSRYRLAALLGRTRGKVYIAAALLTGKAQRSPNTAEAHAHKLLLETLAEIDGWAIDAGAAVGIDASTLTRDGPNGQATKETPPAPAPAGGRSDLRAGGEAQAGQAADALPG